MKLGDELHSQCNDKSTIFNIVKVRVFFQYLKCCQNNNWQKRVPSTIDTLSGQLLSYQYILARTSWLRFLSKLWHVAPLRCIILTHVHTIFWWCGRFSLYISLKQQFMLLHSDVLFLLVSMLFFGDLWFPSTTISFIVWFTSPLQWSSLKHFG